MPAYRILSIDGGGLRGIISARVLDRLEREFDLGPFYRGAELLGGTSTGGILALGLSAGFSAAELVALYVDDGPRIFDDSWLDNLRDLGKLVGAQYATRPLREALTRRFGELRLGELPNLGAAGMNPRQNVLVTAFDLYNDAPTTHGTHAWKPKIFHNCSGPDCDARVRVVDAALYTSAAPTYFPSVDGYIDGGVFANNPSLVCIAQALDGRRGDDAGIEDLRLFSLGTGFVPRYLRRAKLDWGVAQWSKPLIDLLQDGVADIARFQCEQLLGRRFVRVQPLLDPPIALDDVDRIADMLAVADAVPLDGIADWLRREWL